MIKSPFLVGLARAFGAAIFFALPLLMTMEMWWLGFSMDPLKLALFLILMIPMLIGLSHYSGFEETVNWVDDSVDGFVAFGVGFVASAIVLILFNVVQLSMGLREIVGMIAIQAIPASFGAALAASQLHGSDDESGDSDKSGKDRRERAGYFAELFFMTVGAIFLAFNVAPTEEMILIAFRMTEWHGLALVVVSLVMMHAFVYAVEFKGAHAAPEGTPIWKIFLKFTTVGYVLALIVSAYVLWTFGRYDGIGFSEYLMMTIVLGFPASLGAAAARLIL